MTHPTLPGLDSGDCGLCGHSLDMHAESYKSPAGDDGTQGKSGRECLVQEIGRLRGCGCWLDRLPVGQGEMFG